MIPDLIWAWRQMSHRPRLAIGVVLILGLACSAATTLFGVVDRLWLHPLDLPAPAELHLLWEAHPALPAEARVGSLGLYHAFHGEPGGPEGARLTASRPWRPVWLDPADGSAAPDSLEGARIAHDFFPTLELAPALGRDFEATDARPGAEPVVIVSHDFWRFELGSDPAVIGRTLRLDIGSEGPATFTIVGVMPATPILDEPLVFGRPRIWAPLVHDPARAPFDRRFYRLIARLPGADSGPVERWQGRFRALAAEHPATFRDWQLRLDPVAHEVTEPYRPALSALFWIMALVFGAACANVAILLSARAAERARELDLRQALGARPQQLARQLLCEGLVLASVAALVGWIASHAVLAAVARFAHHERRLDVGGMGWALGFGSRSLVFAAGLALLTAGLFSLLPILRVWHRPEGLAARGRSLGQRNRWRRPLLRLEMTVAMVLVTCSALVGTSLSHLLAVDPGFRVEGVRALDLRLPRSALPSAEEAIHPLAPLLPLVETLDAHPRIASAALVHPLPMSGQSMGGEARSTELETPVRVGLRGMGPGLVSALGIPLLEGRDFEPWEAFGPPSATDDSGADDPEAEDAAGTPGALPPVILSRGLARILWPTTSALDRELILGWNPGRFRVVGIVGDIHHTDLETPPEPTVYLPLRHFPTAAVTLVLRDAAADTPTRDIPPIDIPPIDIPSIDAPPIDTAALRDLVRGQAPMAVIEGLAPIAERVADATRQERLVALIFTALALLGLALAISGTWAVIALGISQRRREIGLRLALGAPPNRLVRELVIEVGFDTVLGIALGLVGLVLGGRLIEGLLFGVTVTDFPMLMASALLLLASTLTIAFGAARRLRHFLPAEVLHED